MVTKGLIVRLHARPGQEQTLADFLRSALSLVQDGPESTAWFAFRAGSSFAIGHHVELIYVEQTSGDWHEAHIDRDGGVTSWNLPEEGRWEEDDQWPDW